MGNDIETITRSRNVDKKKKKKKKIWLAFISRKTIIKISENLIETNVRMFGFKLMCMHTPHKFSSLIFSRAKKSNTKEKKLCYSTTFPTYFSPTIFTRLRICIHGFVFTRKCVRETIVHTHRDFESSFDYTKSKTSANNDSTRQYDLL